MLAAYTLVEALSARPNTARIPILVVTAKQITPGDRDRLHGYVAAIMEKSEFTKRRFAAEVRRAMAGRPVTA